MAPYYIIGEKSNQCASTTRQSPIDLPGKKTSGVTHKLRVTAKTMTWKVKDFSKYTEQVSHFKSSGFHGLNAPKNNGNFIMVQGLKYELLQFHWHFASEHQVDGKTRPGEMHFVFGARCLVEKKKCPKNIGLAVVGYSVNFAKAKPQKSTSYDPKRFC